MFTQPFFRRISKKTSKLRVTGLCAGNSSVTGEFPAQMVSNAENLSIWWRHHGYESEYLPTRPDVYATNRISYVCVGPYVTAFIYSFIYLFISLKNKSGKCMYNIWTISTWHDKGNNTIIILWYSAWDALGDIDRHMMAADVESWAPFQYPIRRLIVRSREVSRPRDW